MEREQRQSRGTQEKYPFLQQVLAAWELFPVCGTVEGNLCRIKCQQGKWWALKRVEQRDRALFIGSLLSQLSRYQLTPPVMKTKYGDTVAYWCDGCYYLTPLVRGKSGSNRKLADVSLAAQRLALLHRYGKHLSLPHFQGDCFQPLHSRLQQYQAVCHPGGGARGSLENRLDKIEDTELRLAAADFLYRIQSRLASFPRHYLAELERQATATGTVCHGHYHCGQVLKEHRSAFIVHWEESVIGVQLLDLADFCYKVLSKNKWQPEYYLAILNGYQNILPLSDREKDFLEQTLLLPGELEQSLVGKREKEIKGRRLEKILSLAIEAERKKLDCLAAAKGGVPLPSAPERHRRQKGQGEEVKPKKPKQQEKQVQQEQPTNTTEAGQPKAAEDKGSQTAAKPTVNSGKRGNDGKHMPTAKKQPRPQPPPKGAQMKTSSNKAKQETTQESKQETKSEANENALQTGQS